VRNTPLLGTTVLPGSEFGGGMGTGRAAFVAGDTTGIPSPLSLGTTTDIFLVFLGRSKVPVTTLERLSYF
jgi:hypothetical protein